MSYTPNHSYRGNYYYNPHWIQASGSNPPSLVYGNMVNFTVGPDGTHYFHQMYTGQFTAPASQTVELVVRYLMFWCGKQTSHGLQDFSRD